MHAIVAGSGTSLLKARDFVLTSSRQFVHQRQHSPLAQSELNVKLLDDENAAIVKDRVAETLSRTRAERGFKGLYCVHCKLSGDTVSLAQHVKEQCVFSSLVRLTLC